MKLKKMKRLIKKSIAQPFIGKFLEDWVSGAKIDTIKDNNLVSQIIQQYPEYIYQGTIYRAMSIDEIEDAIRNIDIAQYQSEEYIPWLVLCEKIRSLIQIDGKYCSTSKDLNGMNEAIDGAAIIPPRVLIKFQTNNGLDIHKMLLDFKKDKKERRDSEKKHSNSLVEFHHDEVYDSTIENFTDQREVLAIIPNNFEIIEITLLGYRRDYEYDENKLMPVKDWNELFNPKKPDYRTKY